MGCGRLQELTSCWVKSFVLLAYGNFKTFKVVSFKTDSVQRMCIFSFNF